MRELEERRAESHSFLPKLQDKLRKLQDELTNANRTRADAEQLSQLAENRLIDAQENLEMVMLDKEVAEERAEMAEVELEEVKEKLAVATVENDVLKEGASKFIYGSFFLIHRFPLGDSEGDDKPIKDSLAYIQLEKQNERLKEALIKWAFSYHSLFYRITFFWMSDCET
jgi:dynactin 1